MKALQRDILVTRRGNPFGRRSQDICTASIPGIATEPLRSPRETASDLVSLTLLSLAKGNEFP